MSRRNDRGTGPTVLKISTSFKLFNVLLYNYAGGGKSFFHFEVREFVCVNFLILLELNLKD